MDCRHRAEERVFEEGSVQGGLLAHGYPIAAVVVHTVFETKDDRIIRFFIERGMDVETNRPLAKALSERIHPAIRIFQDYRDRFPSFAEQANIALRHHCREGNAKWISMLLWAGADPNVPGEMSWDDEFSADGDEPTGFTAFEVASIFHNFAVFRHKQMRLTPETSGIQNILRDACSAGNYDVVQEIIELGVSPNDQTNGGSSGLLAALMRMPRVGRGYVFHYPKDSTQSFERRYDNDEARGLLKIVFYLAKHGARWEPSDRKELNELRKCLLEMTPDYTVEMLWIMRRFRACRKEHVLALVKTLAMQSHLTKHRKRLEEILESWPAPQT